MFIRGKGEVVKARGEEERHEGRGDGVDGRRV